MMTATIVDDMTDTPSDKKGMQGSGHRQYLHLLYRGDGGLCNDWSVRYQRPAGGAVCPPSLPVWSCCVWWSSSGLVSQIPMAALVAVMIMVSIGTFSWRSVVDLKSHPVSTSVVMLATVVVVVATHNLAFGY
jgi:SulP family sulfate permease